MRKKIAAVAAAALLLVLAAGGGATTATADPGDGPYRGGGYFVDNTLGQADMYAPLVDYLRAVPNAGVYNSSLNLGIVAENNLAPAVRTKLNAVGTGEQGPKGDTGPAGPQGEPGVQGPAGDPATDVKGGVGVTKDIERQTIANIGGSFATRATNLGTFELPAGTWMVTTSATFYRTVSGAEGTRPQLALRYNGLAGSAGTILGQEISETANRELMQSITWRVTIAEPTTVTAYGFGYNDNTSDAGGGQIDVDAQITAVRG